MCQGLGIPDLGAAFRKPVRSSIPTLLISGTLDGRTPVRNGEEVLAGLKKARHLIIDGAGHSDPLFLSSPKILEAMRAFLGGRELASTRIELPPVEFIAPRTLAKLEDPDRYTGTYRIDDSSTRKVLNAGGVLFTIRDDGPPLPIRPVSQTEFFYEGQTTTLRFETDGSGRVTGMVVFHDGKGPGEPAAKID